LLDDLIAALPGRSPEAPVRRPRAVAKLVLLLDELAAHLGPAHRSVNEQTKPIPPPVLRAVRLLEEELTTAWTTTDLARRVRLSDAYLIRLFKAATGLPPLAYLARLRAERAAGLLLRTDLPVARIAEQVGWPSPYYFARRFKAHFGLPATEYRARFARVRTHGETLNG
ncbi:MAG TPA: helix-turn-helix transcriptional regulator, partial [Tepidisphaeraceae bacterium]|nr:helix-turn-helix transcriptional regulator [Tepidisphaeraceae bacterium]